MNSDLSPVAQQSRPSSQRRRSGDAGIPIGDTPSPSPSPSTPPPASSVPAAASEENTDDITIMRSPPLLRRRAFSCDDDGGRAPSSGLGPTPGGSDCASALRTIPSRSEMDDDDSDGTEDLRRQSLFSTPTRRRGAAALVARRSPPYNVVQNFSNRGRAASSDVVLNVNGCVPSYDDEFATRIAGISDVEAERQASFSTPERQITRPEISRDRANTCPQRPQRHSIFRRQGTMEERDEESGHIADQSMDSEIEEGRSSSERLTPDLNGVSYSRSSSTPLRTFSPEESVTGNSNVVSLSSSERRRRTLTALSSPLSATSNNNTATSTTIVEIPNSPQVRSRAPPVPSSSSAAVILTATQQAHAQAQNCIFRVNPHVMKALMVLSLYMLLAYTWNTDLRVRYRSTDINYGLSEYWQGGLSSRVGAAERIGRNTGKLFNDDGGVDDPGIAKLINGLKGSGDDKLDAGDSASGDASADSASADDAVSALISTMGKNRRRPSLSHARSILADASHPAYGVQSQRRRATAAAARRPPQSGWTLTRLAWALVWIGFALPVVEAGIREARRQINLRFWNVRRLRSFRAVPRGVPGRLPNVHNL